MNLPSYSSGPQTKPLLAMTIGAAFDLAVERFPAREALVVRHQELRYTWKQLADEVDRCAQGLLSLGLEVGERVGIWSPNCAQWCIVQFATAKVGVVLVNINPAYRLSEVEYALKHSGCRWLISSDVFKSSNYHEILYTLLPELKSCDVGAIKSDKLPELRGVITLSEQPAEGMLSWTDLLGRAAMVGRQKLIECGRQLQFDDPINIQYTSGTTGAPKGATLSHYSILNNAYMVGESMRLTEHDRLVIPVPLYHCFGMVMGNLGCMTRGSTMIYPGASFEPLATLQAVAEEQATAMFGVPTMFISMLDHPERTTLDLSSLRTGIMAGSTCPIEVMRRVIEEMHLTEMQIAYGMTETSPISTQTGPEDEFTHRITSVGRTQPHLESKIIDEHGRIVTCGQIGELCTRGYSVMLGYWNNPQATIAAVDAAGWMHTGDLATMDEEGYINIVGRNKDMIIRGGENVYPREIEEFLFTHPAVADVQVIGVPDETYGEEIIAWVKLHPGHLVDAESLRDYCKNRIAHFKIPRSFKLVDEFPMTISGKIQKFRMREVSIAEREAVASKETVLSKGK